jgi:hypothetical protein
MRRLNVQFNQIGECIRLSMFAMEHKPINPPLQEGEILLLQVTKSTANNLNISQRIQFAIEFDRIEEDLQDESLRIWGRKWKYILYGNNTVAVIPFDLEDIPSIGTKYSNQTQGVLIAPEDERKILPFIEGARDSDKAIVARNFGEDRLVQTLFNYDSIYEIISKEEYSQVRERMSKYHTRNPWTAQALKSLYDHKCQICKHDFKPKYNSPYAETHHIDKVSGQEYSKEPLDKAKNIVVLCPNHHRIIEHTNALFIPGKLSFKYPNGLIEPLKLEKHLTYQGPNYGTKYK